MYNINLTYDEYKNHVLTSSTKDIPYQHVLTEEGERKYYYLFAPEGNIIYECKLNNITSTGLVEILDYEASYSARANKPIEPREAETGIPKSKPRPVEGTLGMTFMYFNTGGDSVDYGEDKGESITISTSTGTTTLGEDTGVTRVTASPNFSYYIDGGGVRLLGTSTGEYPIVINFVMAPNIPAQYGGSWKFVRNKKLFYYQDKYELDVPPKYVKYYEANPYANQVQIEVYHDKNISALLEFWIKIYR